ncbi:MAG: hypothetical protein QG670_552 [Thermoproteota archaeon]|nr:hypothetical protein [Thermoproteota archaeon]
MLRAGEDIREFSLAESDSLVKLLQKDLYEMRRTSRPDIFPMLTLALTLQMTPITRSNQIMTLLIKKSMARKFGSIIERSITGNLQREWLKQACPNYRRIASSDIEQKTSEKSLK